MYFHGLRRARLLYARALIGQTTRGDNSATSTVAVIQMSSKEYTWPWHTYIRVWINRTRLPILLVVSWTGKTNISPSVPVRAWEFRLARRVRPSRPASACSFFKLRLNLVLTRGIPLDLRGGVLCVFYYWLVEFSRKLMISKSSPWTQGRKTLSGREKRRSHSSMNTTISTTDDARYIYCCNNIRRYIYVNTSTIYY